MTASQDGWMQAAFAPARELELTDSEIAPALVRVAAQAGPGGPDVNEVWRRRMTHSRRTLVLVIVAILLAATAAIATTGVIDIGIGNPIGGGQDADPREEGNAIGEPGDGGSGAGSSVGGHTSDDERKAGDPTKAATGHSSTDAERQAEAERVRTALDGIYDALRSSDVGHICRQMTPKARRETAKSGPAPGMSCIEALGRYYAYAERDDESFRRSRTGRVIAVTTGGKVAVATVKFRSGVRRNVEMIKEEGHWTIPVRGLVPTSPGAEALRALDLVNGLYKALRAADTGRACDLMTRHAQKEMAKTGKHSEDCAAALGRYYDLDGGGNLKLRRSRTGRATYATAEGDVATVTVAFHDGGQRLLTLHQEDGEWRLPSWGGVDE